MVEGGTEAEVEELACRDNSAESMWSQTEEFGPSTTSDEHHTQCAVQSAAMTEPAVRTGASSDVHDELGNDTARFRVSTATDTSHDDDTTATATDADCPATRSPTFTHDATPHSAL